MKSFKQNVGVKIRNLNVNSSTSMTFSGQLMDHKASNHQVSFRPPSPGPLTLKPEQVQQLIESGEADQARQTLALGLEKFSGDGELIALQQKLD